MIITGYPPVGWKLGAQSDEGPGRLARADRSNASEHAYWDGHWEDQEGLHQHISRWSCGSFYYYFDFFHELSIFFLLTKREIGDGFYVQGGESFTLINISSLGNQSNGYSK